MMTEKIEYAMQNVEKYDDSDLSKKVSNLNEYSEKLTLLMDTKFKALEIPEAYNDSSLKEMLENFSKKNHDRLEKLEGIKGYDDSGLQEQINGIKAVFEKEVATLKKEVNAPLKVEIPTTKHYDGEVTPEGDMVLHANNLYVNLLKDNDSVPSLENKSYKLIIKAPKTPEHKGVYKKDHDYEYNDIVMWDNASWIKTAEKNQDLPSEGWKLLAKAVRGKKGEKGDVTHVESDYTDVIQELSDEVNILKATIKGLKNATD